MALADLGRLPEALAVLQDVVRGDHHEAAERARHILGVLG